MGTTLTDLQADAPSSDRLGVLDRAALLIGVALIRWADRSEQARGRRLQLRRERAARAHEVAAIRAQLEHERVLARSYPPGPGLNGP